MSEARRRKWISFETKKRYYAMPCAVCGVPYDIEVDHITPFARGGECIEENLQPLCRACNQKKKHLMTNEDLRLWVVARGIKHFMEAVYRHDTRYYNPYDGPCMFQWKTGSPQRLQHAHDLFKAFQAA